MSPSASSEQDPVRFTVTGGDVFAWHQRVVGEATCDRVSVLIGDTVVERDVLVEEGRFAATVPIRPGTQQVVAACEADGAEIRSEPLEFTGMLQPRPKAWIDVAVEGGDVVLDGSRSEATEEAGTPVRSWTWSPGEGNPAPLTLSGQGGSGRFAAGTTGARIAVHAPPVDGAYTVTLEVADARGHTDTSTTYFLVEDGVPRAVDVMDERPPWIEHAVVYAPIAPLWGDGGFATVDDHLQYLADLGVDALWLWPPVTRRAPGEEYAIADYFTIDGSWGPARDLKTLVRHAHELGMRVLLDFVPNHSSDEHRYFRAAERDGEASHYWDFYDRDESGRPTHYFDWTNLPNLNYDNPQVRRMMTDAFSYWVREFDVDGFRVDAAWGIDERRPDYWPQWRRELTRIKGDAFLLAEAPAYDRVYFHRTFDAAFDWSGDLGHWAWTGAFDEPQIAAEWLDRALTSEGKGFDPNALILRFLNNNDTGVRFVDQYGPVLTKLAAALEFTVAGVPLMFAGDEIGASYQPYNTLHKIPWKDRDGLRPWYERLIRLKHTMPALWGGDMAVLDAQNVAVVAYVRPAPAGAEPLLVLINFGRTAPVTVVDDRSLAPFAGAGRFTDLLSGDDVRVSADGEDLTLEMPAKTAYVLVRGGGP